MDQQSGLPHVVLLGDSIFDNGAYVPGEPDVVRQLRSSLPPGAGATLLAIDGAVVASVQRQLERLPKKATLLVVSAGGNDALREAGVLQNPASTVGDAVLQLAQAQARFAERYEAMLDTVLAAGSATAVCTIYNANYPAPQGVIVRAALGLFNDAITRAAFSRCVDLIDLRLICDEPADYADPIEPSSRGGAKIAAAIAKLAAATPLEPCRSLVIAN